MPERRPLKFSAFDEIADDVRRLRSGGCERTGAWTLPQACHHLNESLKWSMRPGPFPPNTPEQEASTPRFEQILASGRLPDGLPGPEAMMPPPDAGDAAVDAFLDTLERYDAYDGPLAPHRLFGHRSRDELRQLARIHCAHHLSHLVPATATGDRATNG
jgi:hypothetical protein